MTGIEDKEISIPLSEFVDSSLIYITDDVTKVTAKDVVNKFKSIIYDEGIEGDTLDSEVRDRITVSKSEVEKAIKELNSQALILSNHYKNIKFKKERDLTKAEIYEAVKKLAVEDYTYSLISKDAVYAGDILSVFVVKDKDFDNSKLDNLILYIKVDTYEKERVTIISFHEAERDESDIKPYKESIFETFNEDLDEQIKVIFKCSLYQGNSLKPANLENIDLDAALRSVIVKDIRNFIEKFNIANNLNLENEADWTRFSIDIDDTNLENVKLVKINLFDNENNTSRAKELLEKSGDFSNSMILLDNEDNYHTFTVVYRIVEVN